MLSHFYGFHNGQSFFLGIPCSKIKMNSVIKQLIFKVFVPFFMGCLVFLRTDLLSTHECDF